MARVDNKTLGRALAFAIKGIFRMELFCILRWWVSPNLLMLKLDRTKCTWMCTRGRSHTHTHTNTCKSSKIWIRSVGYSMWVFWLWYTTVCRFPWGKLGEVCLGSLCIVSYDCIWTYTYLKRLIHMQKKKKWSSTPPLTIYKT